MNQGELFATLLSRAFSAELHLSIPSPKIPLLPALPWVSELTNDPFWCL
jgi:hypothetical protein